MFDELKILMSINPIRSWVIIIGLAYLFLLILWVSIIDLKKKSVTFWKMLIVSGSTILVPLIGSFFCGCKYLKWFLVGAIFLWFLLLFLNIRFNNDKIIGKADLDLLSAIFSELIMCSIWIFVVVDNYPLIRITKLWYLTFMYLLVGALIYLAFFLISVIYNIILFKKGVKSQISGIKISALPMFIPIVIMIPYNIMVL